MVPSYMVNDNSSSVYADSTWNSRIKLPSRMERMHYSLGGAGLRTQFSRFIGSGWVCLGSSGRRSRCALTGVIEPQGPSLQALTILGGARFITWRLSHCFFGEYRCCSKHFWNHRACLGSGPPKKVLVPQSSGWWHVRQILITSKRSRAYVLRSGRRWAGTHFGRQRFICSLIWSGVSWFQW